MGYKTLKKWLSISLIWVGFLLPSFSGQTVVQAFDRISGTKQEIARELIHALKKETKVEDDITITTKLSAATEQGILSSHLVLYKATGQMIMGIALETDQGHDSELYQVYVHQSDDNQEKVHVTLVNISTQDTYATEYTKPRQSATAFRRVGILSEQDQIGFGGGGGGGGIAFDLLGWLVSIIKWTPEYSMPSMSSKTSSGINSVTRAQVSYVEDALDADMEILRLQKSKSTPVVSPQEYRPSYISSIGATAPVVSIPIAEHITVTKGMTLFSIARANQTSVSELKRINGLTSDLIVIGQIIRTRDTTSHVTRYEQTITVQAGQTLWRIATQHGLSVEALKQANGLTSDTIYVGQQLRIPTKVTPSVSSSSQVVPTPSETKPVSTPKSVTVQPGDTLWGISHRNGVTVDELKQANGLTSDTIYIGQQLRIPTKVAPSVSSSSQVVPTPSEAKPVSTPKSVTVQPGDTLWGISHRNGVTVDELKQVNGLTSDTIYVGQQLRIPTKVTPSVSSPSQVVPTPSEAKPVSTPKSVTVQPGDTLWRISHRNGITVDELKQANGLTSDTIYVGQQLRIPTKVTPSVSSPSQVVPTPSEAKPVSTPKSVTVQPSDTLWRISHRNGVTVDELKQANGLTSDTIYVGQTLVIPQSVPSSISAANAQDKEDAKDNVKTDTQVVSQTGECQPKPEDLGPHVTLGYLDDLPENVQKAFRGYESVKWRGNFKGQKNTKAGGNYENNDKELPTIDACGKHIEYKKFDINEKIEGQGRDAERFIVGSDGSVYYTKDHYKNFIKIK
ncbi:MULTISPECIES: LysM peptidoglycan-binding domain-containing protein [unclassified Granulicatella]|uniref:LysM peptidoglycan-binding domain-containing protein n=1 Tax=unclassified Granulicatella TaxID=2630493 RepID=UPI0010746A4A|nr:MULTISPECIES: LysM peptidoglycan-binding domain-containing protein [unclassified Granulicatella]MBF0779505.1 LysM peptidoglycan-binding domain-containing protein [Granulicatella sp. 19428wC4_WM01]TFU96471.1 LysM peptidoglycan-binding domain-containing protein [Granulicatella sp. WM01]